MNAMRRAIAEHMLRSIQTSAHVTTVFEIDMAKVVAIREKLKREYDSHGVKLTYLPFIVRAAVDALGKWPRLNAELRGDTIVTKSAVNLGIAVALDDGKGLIVPVIRNAEEKNLLGIARSIADLAERARTKKLLPDDVQGGTFTITNPGGFGAIAGTPIINQPQVGILDVEAIVKRPVVIADEHGNDMIAIRPMMNLCLSYDHRLVDGAYAAPFMRDLRINLETWDEGRTDAERKGLRIHAGQRRASRRAVPPSGPRSRRQGPRSERRALTSCASVRRRTGRRSSSSARLRRP